MDPTTAMMGTFNGFTVAGVLWGALAGTSIAAEEPTVVEALIAAQNPCEDFKTERFGVTIGIDKLREVRLRTARAELDGNDISLSFEGHLACETSDVAVLTGDAATSISAATQLSLSDCSISAFDITLSEFAGTFGGLLRAFAPHLEQEIAAATRPKLIEACQKFRGSGR